jgi:hypothetical protein
MLMSLAEGLLPRLLPAAARRNRLDPVTRRASPSYTGASSIGVSSRLIAVFATCVVSK